MTRRRTRLSLGPNQVQQTLMALAYAIDTFVDDDEPNEIREGGRKMVREWEALREVIRRERDRQASR